jgi:glycosyltransferase involved in cell wall biosynthesis
MFIEIHLGLIVSSSNIGKFPPALPGKRGWPWESELPVIPEAVNSGRSWPKINIITPSFNQGAFIEETIRSVLLQSYPNIEYIIIDGGSTDGTVEIIRKYEQRLAFWVSEPDEGQADALRRGFELAKGEILAYLNADDLYTPNAVETAFTAFQDDPDLALVHGDSIIINDAGEKIGHKRGEEGAFLSYFLSMANPISQPSAFWRRSDYESIGGIDSKLHYVLDYDLWSRMGLVGKKFRHIAADLSLFRIHASSKTQQSMLPFEQERLELIQTYLQDMILGPILSPHLRRLFSAVHLRLANAYWVEGDKHSAWTHYQRAIRYSPRITFSWPSLNLILRFMSGRRSFRQQVVDKAS